MFKKILIALVAVVAIILIAASFQPGSFRLERSTTIAAKPAKVYALLVDFHRWPEWSPWEHKDPAMKKTYGGAAKGVGATYAWEGNGQVGKGSMTIAEATPSSRVAIALDFEKPMNAHNQIEFTLKPQGKETELTWAMAGPTPFVGKVIHLFVSMDKMVGKDFDEGLANLKAAAEARKK